MDTDGQEPAADGPQPLETLPVELTACILRLVNHPLICTAVCRQWRELVMQVCRVEATEYVDNAVSPNNVLIRFANAPPAAGSFQKYYQRTRQTVHIRYLSLCADTLEGYRLVAGAFEHSTHGFHRNQQSIVGAMWRFLDAAQPPAANCRPEGAGAVLDAQISACSPSDTELLIGVALAMDYEALLEALARRRVNGVPLCPTEMLARAICYAVSINNLRAAFTAATVTTLRGTIEALLVRPDIDAAVPWEMLACIRHAAVYEGASITMLADQFLLPSTNKIRARGYGKWLLSMPVDVFCDDSGVQTAGVKARHGRCRADISAEHRRLVSRGKIHPDRVPLGLCLANHELVSYAALHRITTGGLVAVRPLTLAEFNGELQFTD